MNKTYIGGKRQQKRRGCAVIVLRGAVFGLCAFFASVLILPLILSRFEAPERYIATFAAIAVAFTSFVCAFATNFGNSEGFIIRGLACALALCLALGLLSLIFGRNDEKCYAFGAVILFTCLAFSLLGARLSMVKRKKRRRKNA